MSQVTFIICSIFPPTKNRIGLILFAKKYPRACVYQKKVVNLQRKSLKHVKYYEKVIIFTLSCISGLFHFL